MTSKEAVETLNKYRNQNYNSTDKDEVELANAINVILPKYVKQEKLLELYKQIALLWERRYEYTNSVGEREKLWKIVKELENDK